RLTEARAATAGPRRGGCRWVSGSVAAAVTREACSCIAWLGSFDWDFDFSSLSQDEVYECRARDKHKLRIAVCKWRLVEHGMTDTLSIAGVTVKGGQAILKRTVEAT